MGVGVAVDSGVSMVGVAVSCTAVALSDGVGDAAGVTGVKVGSREAVADGATAVLVGFGSATWHAASQSAITRIMKAPEATRVILVGNSQVSCL